MLKQLHRIGSLAVGKQADLVMIRATDLNMQPVHDAVNSVVMQTSLANIHSGWSLVSGKSATGSCWELICRRALRRCGHRDKKSPKP